jgi:hypothetical protein
MYDTILALGRVNTPRAVAVNGTRVLAALVAVSMSSMGQVQSEILQ